MSVTRVESIRWPSTHEMRRGRRNILSIESLNNHPSPRHVSGLVEALSARLGVPSRPRASAVRAKG
jgi:hypothetical protein